MGGPEMERRVVNCPKHRKDLRGRVIEVELSIREGCNNAVGCKIVCKYNKK